MAQKIAGLLVKLSADSAELKSDLRQIKSSLRGFGNRANREANRVKYAFNKIRRAAQVVASAFIFTAGIRRMGMLVASMAAAEDQVKLMQARFQQFAREGDAFTKIYNQSKRLGVSLKETADGMTRLLVATKGLGTSQAVLQDVLTNITILGRAGGTSAEEMKGAMRQLSQGLASGRLQGEELRSVLENLPLVAMEIADQMDIGIGQIRKAAAEGKITGQVVVDALSEIGIKMEDLPKTWSMQTQNLRTEWDLFLNDLSQAVDEAGLLENLTAAVKAVRHEVLGSFVGISTEALYAQRLEAGARLRELQAKQQDAKDKPDLPTPKGAAAIEAMSAFSGGTGAHAYTVELSNQRRLLEDINKEIKKRNELEELANKAKTAKDAFKADEELQKRIKSMQTEANKLRASIESDQKAFFDLVASMDEMVALTDLTAAEASDIIAQKYEEIMEAARKATDEEKKLLNDMANEWEEVAEEMSEYAKQAARNMQDAFADFLFDPFEDGVKGMLEGFLTAIRRMIAEQAAASFFESTGIGGFIKGIFGRASGGPVAANTPYVVGEMGPEIFVPSSSGDIIPNGMGGVVVNQNYRIEAGADWATLQKVLPPLFDRNREATVAEVRNRLNEGNL